MKGAWLAIWMVLPVAAVTVVEEGKSGYRIVLGAEARAAEERAARELQHFLGEMSGARLEVVRAGEAGGGPKILIGKSAAEKVGKVKLPAGLGAEGFLLRTVGRDVVIAGEGERGTMYGVYTLLDKLGCRWFTREVSRIPKRRTVDVGKLDEVQKPAFEYREPFFTEAWDKEWAARNRTNGDHTKLDASTGGKLQYYPFVHSFYELLPPQEHFEAHPEYYSLIDGKRRVERGQLCLTNKEVLRLAIAKVEKWIVEHPEATIFSVSQNDWEGWCECDQCRRVEEEEGGTHSGPVLRFVNAVAEAIGKKHPGKLIDTLAYWYTEDPPAKVRPVANVRIRLCPIGICTAHSFESCPRSAYFKKNLEAWSRITNQLYIWHYNTNFAHYLLPFPDFDELAADVPVYKKHGVVGLFLQGAYAPGGGGEQSELRAYVLARMLWDVGMNVERTVGEFLEGVYGAAAGPMKEYFELLQREVRGPAGKHLWIFNVPEYSAEFVQRALEMFGRAEKMAGEEGARRRVLQAKLPVEYYGLLRDMKYEVRDGFYGPRRWEELAARGKELIGRMKTFGIESIHEGVMLEKDEQMWAGMKPLRAYRMENAGWRVDVVPALNGRVVSLVDKRGRGEVLRAFPPGERGYPALGGQMTTVHGDYHGKAWEVDWQVEEAVGTRVRMVGKAENGVVLRRELELTGEGLVTRMRVENRGAAAVVAAVQARVEVDGGDIDRATVGYVGLDGKRVERRLVEAGVLPNGRENWSGAGRPAGEVRIGEVLKARFDGVRMERSYVSWTAKSRPGVTLGVWGEEGKVGGGEVVEWVVGYGLAER